MTFKLYKNYLLTIIFIITIICISFYQYMEPRFSKEEYEFYNTIEKECKVDQNKKICQENGIVDLQAYNAEMEYDARERRKSLDTITLSSEIIENCLFSISGVVMPLFVVILVILSLNDEIKSGLYQNILLRKEYKKYLKEKLKNILGISLIYPLSISFIVLVSCIITNFNFNISTYNKGLAVYNAFKENNYLLYFLSTCIFTYLSCILYGLIAFICYIKEKTAPVAITKAYLLCIVIAFLDYYIIGYIILNVLLGDVIHVSNFNILGYSQLGKTPNLSVILFNLIILCLFPLIYIIKKYRKKEDFYEEIERQTANI